MYVPSHFRMDRPEMLVAFVRTHSFGTLVTIKDGYPFATHVPFLVRTKDGRINSLEGHVARANPQWNGSLKEATAIFAGPHAYISPRWYGEANTVPTWNYQAVHVRGELRWFETPGEILAQLRALVAVYEAPQAEPWDMAGEEAFVGKLASAVVGFELRVSEVFGKSKLSQNHSPARRARVIAALKKQPDRHAQEIARLMLEIQ